MVATEATAGKNLSAARLISRSSWLLEAAVRLSSWVDRLRIRADRQLSWVDRQFFLRLNGNLQSSGTEFRILDGTSKTGLAPIEFQFLSRLRGIRSVPVPFFEVPLNASRSIDQRMTP